MDQALNQIAQSAISFAGKAAYSYAASIALKRVNNLLLRKVEATTTTADVELDNLKAKLERKLSIILPIIDKIQLNVAKGNQEFQACLTLSTELSQSLHDLSAGELKITQFRETIDLIDEMIPLLSLTLHSLKPHQGSESARLSYSRLLKASSALVMGETTLTFGSKTTASKTLMIPIGPVFPVRLYSLFEGSARKTGNDFTWKEEYFKATCQMHRYTNLKEKKYSLLITQDLNDSRFHEEVDASKVGNGMIPGPSKLISILDISRMYYTLSGSLLNIEESRLPVLVLKLVFADEKTPPNQTPKSSGLKTEWIALELLMDMEFNDISDTESQDSSTNTTHEALKNLSIKDTENEESTNTKDPAPETTLDQLCLLEYLIRLACLEETEQISHTNVSDSLFYGYFENEIESNPHHLQQTDKPSTLIPGSSSKQTASASPLSARKPRGLLGRFLESSSG